MLPKSLLDNLNHDISAIDQSDDIQRRVANVGFDWHDAKEVIQVLKDEIAELEEALQNKDTKHMQEEFGDILFTCVNLARHLNISIEDALNYANQKFSTRFQIVEKLMQQEQRDFKEFSFAEMLEYWQRAKKILATHADQSKLYCHLDR
jgi:uncharacterized protein YabN with tetrapyrrole methylase and pyrophosphatase domain